MSKWTHAMCEKCWNAKRPDRPPVRMNTEERSTETCCFCGEKTASGIYYRADPNDTLCRGEHRMEA